MDISNRISFSAFLECLLGRRKSLVPVWGSCKSAVIFKLLNTGRKLKGNFRDSQWNFFNKRFVRLLNPRPGFLDMDDRRKRPCCLGWGYRWQPLKLVTANTRVSSQNNEMLSHPPFDIYQGMCCAIELWIVCGGFNGKLLWDWWLGFGLGFWLLELCFALCNPDFWTCCRTILLHAFLQYKPVYLEETAALWFFSPSGTGCFLGISTPHHSAFACQYGKNIYLPESATRFFPGTAGLTEIPNF